MTAGSGAYVMPATVGEVPNIRRLGMHFDQTLGWVEHICCHPEPCNHADCSMEGLLPRSPHLPQKAEEGDRG